MPEKSPQVFSSTRAKQTGPVWAVSAYFNPVGYRSRLANYRIFRSRLALPLLTMAIEYRDEPELLPADADILVRLTQGAVLWQKERLYNEALKYLPQDCKRIIWLDADLIFPEPDWPEQVDRALDRFPVVQAFSRLKHERGSEFRDAAKLQLEGAPDEWSAASLLNRNQPVSTSRESTSSGPSPRYIQGVAWATTREFIEHCGFFDSTIIGSGDSAFWSAVSGDPQVFLRKPRTEGVVAAWRKWQGKAFEACEGRVGHVDSWVASLWHGQHANRRYPDRWKILRQHDFDPREDIAVGPQGSWVWSSPKTELHADVRSYFVERREDEEAQEAEVRI